MERKKLNYTKICQVCGDLAKCSHFGGIACDGCKAFFRRVVQTKKTATIQCKFSDDCVINASTRKDCAVCRLNKCLSIGMEESWVLSEEERIELNRKRLIRKRKISETATQSQRQLPTNNSNANLASATADHVNRDFLHSTKFQNGKNYGALPLPLENMTQDERNEIESLLALYYQACLQVPFPNVSENGQPNALEIIEMFTKILCQFVNFSQLSNDFAKLGHDEKKLILNEAAAQMCFLLEAVCFDGKRLQWPSAIVRSLLKSPPLEVDVIKHLIPSKLYAMHINFMQKMKLLQIDESIGMLLIMIVLSSERALFASERKILEAEERYLELLKKYIILRFGPENGRRLYPRFLTSLADLRELSDTFRESDLIADRNILVAIREHYL